MDNGIDGKNILVTGGTGSFGQKFVETLLVQQRIIQLLHQTIDQGR